MKRAIERLVPNRPANRAKPNSPTAKQPNSLTAEGGDGSFGAEGFGAQEEAQ